MTAPSSRPRVEGEVVEAIAHKQRGVHYAAIEFGDPDVPGSTSMAHGPEIRALAADLLDARAEVARLTAEVERLRHESGELRKMVEEALNWLDSRWYGGRVEKQARMRERLAALALPTPAPEAKDV